MVNRVASILGLLVALGFAIAIALGLGVAAYVLSSPEIMAHAVQGKSTTEELPSVEFIFFSIFAFCFLLWATLPLSIGSSRQFEPGRLLMYPISLRKLFALDFISEVTSLQSVFAIPAITAICIGAGLGSGSVGLGLLAAVPIAAFGLALSKWLSTSLGSLLRRRRTRGETLLALIGAAAGLGGALIGQIAPTIFRHAETVKELRWTPPGAAALALTNGLAEGNTREYTLAVLMLVAYVIVLVTITYWIAKRSVLGKGGAKSRTAPVTVDSALTAYTGWELPLLPPQLAAVVEKEMRYLLRNAQVRMMVLMPLILIVIRLANTTNPMSGSDGVNGRTFFADFLYYGEGLMAAGGVLYVFLMLTGLSCNQFAFEEGGMRTLILSPVRRSYILIGKNVAISIIALLFSTGLLIVDELVFGDITPRAILFVAFTFVILAMLMSALGNWLSIQFPKRMKFGKRLNVSGVVGLLLIPMVILLSLPPLIATAAGYFTRSVPVVYVTLAGFAVLAGGVYLLSITRQGAALQRREVEILEAVREPTDD